jgi:adenylosuccinate lyase
LDSQKISAISALDGRYAEQLKDLSSIVSEGALIAYRLRVEAHWMLQLAGLKAPILSVTPRVKQVLEDIAKGTFSSKAAAEIKDIEKTTNHDVKAVEYWLRRQLENAGADNKTLSHVHFACTSEDINNTAYGLMLKDLRNAILIPLLSDLRAQLSVIAEHEASTPMLSRTHGQAATPTTLGKEIAVFIYRIDRQVQALNNQPILTKFNGAVGNFNAHTAAYPDLDWVSVSKSFIESRLQLAWNPLTTQIESHDSFVEFVQTMGLLNSILIGFCRDMWGYISLGYFAQKVVEGEVGSSTMPHKVNPIYFENAEGNLGLANSILRHFSEKLPISRWQRDLSDSTVLRATGTGVGHSVLAYSSILRGLKRVAVNRTAIENDLSEAWEVLAEPVQTVMRRFGTVDAYEKLKAATRGSSLVTKGMIHTAIDSCAEIPADVRMNMKAWTPSNYVGLAPRLALEFTKK